ncbi:hypothetical protein [Bradyrhizobium sp. RDM4]|uniref:hypothetical protein n=1 Tax=Bradyrhizobium sp. RDM4 TaxID=3378765 RepID=UPI0038FCD14D
MFRRTILTATALSAALFASVGFANAADQPTKADPPAKALKKVPELPFFFINDNRVTFAYLFSGTFPGYYSVNPNGTINGKTAQQVYAFTHFDAWQYGTNLLNIGITKSGHNAPAAPCLEPGVTITGGAANCGGETDIFATLRSTFGWNELFDTKAFTMAPLRNISFLVGADWQTSNNLVALSSRDVVSGLQFAFDLPYRGFLNVSPVVYWQFSAHNGMTQCGLFGPGVPGVSCLADGNQSFKPTWGLETNYYMDLGFLPENLQYFAISGRAAWYGTDGTANNPLPYTPGRVVFTGVQVHAEPIRLTFDASKAIWGPKYTHFVDVWVAYRYDHNKNGADASTTAECNVRPGVSNNSCSVSSLYSGVTVKF